MVSIGKDFKLQDPRIDENDPVCQAALAKLYEASWKFDRGKNGDLLKVTVMILFIYFPIFS